MQIADPLTLDPVEFVPNGAELDLTGDGLRVLEADFGEADVELDLQRQAFGEIPTSYHPPNTVATLKLGVRGEGEVDLPTAAHLVAQKVGEINTPGTEHWLRRDFEVGGDFAGSLGKRVYKATLTGLGGWQRGESPDVTLTLVTGSYWYATLEQESETFESEEDARELIFELASILGTSPGLIRIRVNNLGGEDWRGLILAGECRDHPQDETAESTAALAFEAEDLELAAGAEEEEREGASGKVSKTSGNVVRHSSLSTGWSNLLASGLMSHVGVRRIWARVYDPSEEARKIQLRLKWRSMGGHRWSENSIVTVPLINGFALIDLGECRPERATLGDQGWEWLLLARTTNESFREVDVDKIYVLPTEQYLVVRQPIQPDSSGGGRTLVEDNFQQEDGALTGAVAFIGGTYSGAGDSGDFEVVEDEALAERTTKSDADVNSGRYVFTEESYDGPLAAGVIVGTEGSLEDRAGLLLRYQDTNNWLRVCFRGFSEKIGGGLLSRYGIIVEKRVSGSVATLGSGLNATGSSPNSSISITLDAKGALAVTITGPGAGMLSLSPDADLAEGGSLDAGKMGLYDAHTGSGEVRRTYKALWAQETDVALDKAVFAGRATELRSEGVFRQHVTDDKWGELIPEGFLPIATPSGMEGRKSRFILIPSQGDLGELADSGDNPLSADSLIRPAYLVAREAAA